MSDDGAGFTPVKGSHGRHGLMGMRYRVEADHGTLEVRSSPGQGTRVPALLPLLPTLQAALPTTL